MASAGGDPLALRPMGDLPPDHLIANTDLLPAGTQVFPSKFHMSKQFWVVALATVAVAVLLGVGEASVRSQGGRLTFSILLFVALVAGVVGSVWVWRRDLAAYRERVSDGTWMHGVFLFPNGDVVVRLHAPFAYVECTVDRMSLTSVEVEMLPDWSRCGVARHSVLVVNYVDMRGVNARVCVSDRNLAVHPSLVRNAYVESRFPQPSMLQL